MRLAALFLVFATPALADAPVIEDVTARASGGDWQFSVTLRHGDSGWDDYADGWRVELPDGTVLGTRVLHHPHVNEQPFTRSHRVNIPANTPTVLIRAKDLIGGWSVNSVAYDLPK